MLSAPSAKVMSCVLLLAAGAVGAGDGPPDWRPSAVAYRGTRPFPEDHPPLVIGPAFGNWNDDGALVGITHGLKGISPGRFLRRFSKLRVRIRPEREIRWNLFQTLCAVFEASSSFISGSSVVVC